MHFAHVVATAIAATSCAVILDPDDYADPPRGGAGAAGGSAATGGAGGGGTGGGEACATTTTELTPQWVRAIAEGANAQHALDVGVDSANNVYLLGDCAGMPTLDTGGPMLTDCSFGGDHLIVMKVSSSGELAWSQRIDSPVLLKDRAALAVEGEDDLWIAGGFGAAVGDVVVAKGCDPKAGAGASDAFVMHLGSQGNCTKLVTFGGTGLDSATDVVALGGGEVAIAGRFNGAMTIGSLLNATGNFDTFVARLDANGNPLWATAMNGGANDPLVRLGFGGGKLFAAGTFSGETDCCGNPKDGRARDVFVAGLHPMTGALGATWVFGGAGEERLLDIVVDEIGSPTLLTTFASARLDPDLGVTSNGGNEVLIIGLDPNAALRFALDDDGQAESGGLARDPVTRDLTFVVGSEEPLVGTQSFGKYDVYAGRVGCAGDRGWTECYGDMGDDQTGTAVAAAPAGWVAIAGTLAGTAAFNRTVSINGGTSSDAFVVRFDPAP